MFCEHCGQAISDSSKFCSNCGAAVQQEARSSPLPYASTAAAISSTDQPLRVVRPVFVGWVTLVTMLPIQLFMTVWACLFCGGFSTFGLMGIHHVLNITLPRQAPFVFWGCAAFFGLPALAYIRGYFGYRKTEYRFYPDRLEYFAGSFGIQKRTLDYRNVIEVDLRSGLIQRRYGLGTLMLNTAGFAGNNARSFNGLKVADVPDAETLYEDVKQWVKAAQNTPR